MTRLDRLLAYAESRRPAVAAISVALAAVVAAVDWRLPDVSVGFLYVVPLLVGAAALTRFQIVVMAILCGSLREASEPLQGDPGPRGARLLAAFNPFEWVPGSLGRLAVVTAGFVATGFVVVELNRRRRLLVDHLAEREEQMRLLNLAEQQVRILIETSPLAILILDHAGCVVLENESARRLLGFDHKPLRGERVEPFLPILEKMRHSQQRGGNMRTSVECRGQRLNGEVFLAHVWLSTYATLDGSGLAAVIWDASENLRDREGAGLDSMLATSRILIGAMSHEVRNLASAAAVAYAALSEPGDAGTPERGERHQALGTLILGLEKIASSGLRLAASPDVAVADLGTVLDEARIVIEPMLADSAIQIHWNLPHELPLVQADRLSLLQVFVNLARNSVDALADAPVREVRISAALERDLVVVRFRDSGPGVPNPDDLFRPFQPGAHSLGLGLYISRAILRSNGGGLRYEPQEHGSCFTVELWPIESAVEA
jgi:two-component system, LuxR family, sensor kinase FixL